MILPALIRSLIWRKSRTDWWQWVWLLNVQVGTLVVTLDIGHSAKCLELHRIWSRRITEEFWIQGDKEKKYSLPFNPLTDRNINLGKVGIISQTLIVRAKQDFWICLQCHFSEYFPGSSKGKLNFSFTQKSVRNLTRIVSDKSARTLSIGWVSRKNRKRTE